MTPIQRDIQAATDRFAQEMINLIRVAAREQILNYFGLVDDGIPKLPMPKRRPLYLGPSQTRGHVSKASAKDLSPKLRNAYDRLKKSKRPVTTVSAAKLLKISESNARATLGKLLREQLITKTALGDGTARRIYLPSRK